MKEKIEQEAKEKYPDWYTDYHEGQMKRAFIAGATSPSAKDYWEQELGVNELVELLKVMFYASNEQGTWEQFKIKNQIVAP